MSSSEVEHRYLNIIDNIRQSVKIPVAVKAESLFQRNGKYGIANEKGGRRCIGFI